MSLEQILFLALVQGLTEFLPISSSAHLILVPLVAGWPDQGLAFDVAVHIGTLSAVVWYFRNDLQTMTKDWFISLRQGTTIGESRLAWAVIIATIPAGLSGVIWHDFIATELRSTLIIAITTIVFGLLLGLADWRCKQDYSEQQLAWRGILFIGFAQAIALIPGTSRSGITMTAGRLLGLTRTASARFSFLLSIPVILGSGGLETVKLIRAESAISWSVLIMGALVSAVTAYFCIKLFLHFITRIGMWPFVIYRLILGTVLLVIVVGS